ncbi:peptidoglycan DD-metalloendopeptidase family protein [Litorivivens sp.]|uniref:peptidoglycan DD-metalloendopeptidase family protein n=3 Tax=Litorivivens sp. TaxID=2020868 RepID=UPI0035619A2B
MHFGTRNNRQNLPHPPKKQVVAAMSTFVAVVLLLLLLPGEQAEAKRTAIPLSLEIAPSDIDRVIVDIEQEPLAPITPWDDVTVQPGDSLSHIFQRVGLTARDVHELITGTTEVKPLSRIKPGQQLSFHIQDGQLLAMKLKQNALTSLVYERTAKGFSATELVREPEVRPRIASATISSSLYKAAEDADMPDGLIMELANIFGGVMDFIYDVRAGDHFIVLYEELYIDGQRYKSGKILAAEYVNRGRSYQAFRYTNALGKTGYYSLNGESMQKAFLRAPLEFSRISSPFNPNRLHPIFKTVRPHRGIDYAAPRGTPVYAAGDGRIIEAGYTKANGNYVIIQHGSQYITKYLHLDRKAVRKGDRVDQRQTIGWVGSTGFATGPHLHYEFLLNGVHRNPSTIIEKLPKARKITATEMAMFKNSVQGMHLQLSTYSVQAGYRSPSTSSVGSG